MKKRLLVVAINLIILGCLSSQSITVEMTPQFHLHDREFVSDDIAFVPPQEAIEFIGLSCYHFDDSHEKISYRIKRNNTWSPWLQFEQQYEFVDPSRNAYRTKPIKSVFSSIQFKSSDREDSGLTFRLFVATEREFTPNAAPHHNPTIIQRAGDCDLPEVCFRECWCPTCPVDTSPEFTEPTHLIVHHSAGNNESNDFAQVVEFIWDLHVNTNGWDDVGYNWLIDPNGVLYEGRPDGYQGAHFSCINENTVGICLIGDYTNVQPEAAAITTLVNTLAYEASEHNIEVREQSYHETGNFTLDNVAGHRDSSGSDNACSGTECPGNSFYPLLESIRLQITALPCYSDLSNTENEKTLESVIVFPNPFKQYLNITSDHPHVLSFEIIDINGVVLGVVQSGKENNLSYLNTGIYFLILDGNLVQKIVKD